jgi:hypothetical protein
VTAKGRAIATINLGGGLIFYGCADLLKKKKKDKDKDKKKKKKTSKKAAKSDVKNAKKTSRKASKQARKTSREAVKQAAEKKAKKTAAKKVAKKGVLRAAGKKLIPGEAYLEAAAIAAALLAGAKPAFGADGMSAEEALLEIAEHGMPPDVTISPELMKLLNENPEVMDLFKDAAEGKATSDEAAQAMIDLMQANMDQLDAETLEKLARFTAESDEPELQQTAEEFRKLLEKIKKGAKPGEGGEADPSGAGPDLFDDPAPDKEAKEKTEDQEADAEGTDQAFPEDFTKELDETPAKKDLLKEVVKRAETPDFDDEKIKAFREALADLKPEQIATILAELSAMPKAEARPDGSTDPAGKSSLEIVQEMAATLKAGKPLPTQAPNADAASQDAASTEAEAETPADAAAGLSEREGKWAVAGIKYHKRKGGKKYEVGLRFAYSNEGLAAELEKCAKRKKDNASNQKDGDTAQPASLGTLMVGIGYRTDTGDRIGTFGTVSVNAIEGQRLTLEIRSYKSFVTLDGKPFEQPVALPDLNVVFSEISKSIYDFSKEPKP